MQEGPWLLYAQISSGTIVAGVAYSERSLAIVMKNTKTAGQT